MENSQQSDQVPQSVSQAPQTAQATTQAGMQQGMQGYSNPYPMQGSAAMVPQYQQTPMGQVYQFPQTAAPPSTSQGGQPGSDSLNIIQQQTSLLDRALGLLSMPLGSRNQGEQSSGQVQDYNSQVHRPQHQQGYNPQSQQTPAFSPNSSQHSQQSQMLLNQMQTQAGMQAALTVSEESLSNLSRVAMNAYACDLEERLAVAGEALEKAKMVAGDAIMMRALFYGESEEALHHLAICSLDTFVRSPGGMDIFLEYFVPVIQGINAEYDAQNPQQQAPQFFQPQPQQPRQPQPSAIDWGNGGDPLARGRQGFPAPPEMSAPVRPVDISQVPPSERWKYIDAMAQ